MQIEGQGRGEQGAGARGDRDNMSVKIMRWIGLQTMISWLFPGCAPERVCDEALLAKFQERVYADESFSHALPYRVYIPRDYDSSDLYPLIVYLHSAGGSGNENKAQVEHAVATLVSDSVQGLESSFVLAPQCPKGKQWLNTSFDRMPFTNYSQEEIPQSDAMRMVVRVISSIEREFSIDSDRLYALGVSMGASGTWDMVTRYPDLFAAAITVSGVSDPTKADLISHLSIWAFHGESDEVSDVNNTRNMVSSLRRSGSACRYTEFSGLGHSITRRALREDGLFQWLFEQRRMR